MLLKVCGIHGDRAEDDIEMLAGAGVDLVGLWHGVAGGAADLTEPEFDRLAAAAHRTGLLDTALVTFSGDADAIVRIAERNAVGWVQLHAYQLPAVVKRVKEALAPYDTRVMKVLHMRDRRCTSRRLIQAYEHAGVDTFLIDATTADGRVGSTGTSIPPGAVLTLADELARPFVLAGGITAASRRRYAAVSRHPGFAGVDVDSGARGPDGALRAAAIEALRRAWDPERGAGVAALR